MAGSIDFFSNPIEESVSKQLAPFFTLKNKSKEELLKWLKDSVAHREAEHAEFFRICRNNLLAYKGCYAGAPKMQSDSLERGPMKRTSSYFVNHLYEMTENLVSKMTRIKPAVEVLPSNDEFEDKNAARAVRLLLNHLWYINDVDFLLQKVHRHKYIFGNAYLMVSWDKEKGDLHPDYVKLRKAGKEKEIGTDAPIRIGDVCYELMLPWHILLELNTDFDKSKTAIVKEVKHIDILKDEFPEMAKMIVPSKIATSFNLELLKDERMPNHAVVYTLYHRADKHFPHGKKIVFTNEVILSDEELGYSHGDFPFIRLTDIELPASTFGMSRYQQALNLQNAHNNLSSSIIKNEFLMAAPKWVMPRGACKLEQLGNGRTIVQYQGAVPPQLVQMNPTSSTTFNFRDKTELELGTIMGVHQISRGEPPKGITAAVALQFLNEQETERGISDIAKHNQFIVELAKKTISVAGDYYEQGDNRMLRILGKENRFMVKFFDSANLHKDYDIRIQNSSALPQSQAAKMERVIQTMQYAPSLFTPERWSELLEFGSTEKMYTLITEAINAAESENEDIIEGNNVMEPKEWEDHITHLRVHYKKMQARSFKEEVPQARQEELKLHIKVTEMLAAEKAAINPLFASKLAQLEQFPMFWVAEVPESAEQRQAMVQGQANQGAPITTQIPGSEPGPLANEFVNKGE